MREWRLNGPSHEVRVHKPCPWSIECSTAGFSVSRPETRLKLAGDSPRACHSEGPRRDLDETLPAYPKPRRRYGRRQCACRGGRVAPAHAGPHHERRDCMRRRAGPRVWRGTGPRRRARCRPYISARDAPAAARPRPIHPNLYLRIIRGPTLAFIVRRHRPSCPVSLCSCGPRRCSPTMLLALTRHHFGRR